MLRLAAHFVERDETIVNIERRVFESLRHDWRGALLEFQDEMLMRGARFLVEVLGKTQQQNIAQKIEDRFFQGRVPPLRRRDRALDDGTVFVADRLARRDVGPIDRETGDRFANRASKRLEGEVATPADLLRQPVEHVAENG